MPATKQIPKNKQLTKAQLTKAAKMRTEGKSWKVIREAFGVTTQSSGFFAAWRRLNIDHQPPRASYDREAARKAREAAIAEGQKAASKR